MSDLDRRAFLATLLATSGAAALARAGARAVEDAAPAGDTLVVHLADYEDLSTMGGSVVIDTKGDAGKLIVARTDATTYVVLSAICTHKHCTVGYEPTDRLFECPCHGSEYNLDGTVHHGPSHKALQSYKSTLANGDLTIVLHEAPPAQ